MMEPGKKNIQYRALVSRDKIILPPLHIKLGLMKNLVKAMNREGEAFKYLKKNSHISVMLRSKRGSSLDRKFESC